MVEVLPQLQQQLQQQSELSTITEERKGDLMEQWKCLQSQRPPNVRGKPTPEQIAERQTHSVTAWKERVRDNSTAELEYVTKLIKVKWENELNPTGYFESLRGRNNP